MKHRDLMREVTQPSVNDKYYLVGSRLGAGPCSDVFLGYNIGDSKEEQPVAIKRFIHPESLHNILAAHNEVSILKKCSLSPHVVNCLDYRLETDDTYIIMEYVPDTLHSKIKKKEVTLGLVADYVRQIPELLADLRDAAVVHTDLKPSNIGFKEIGSKGSFKGRIIKAFDFGLAKDFGLAFYREGGQTYSLKNVPSYNPPEMREDEENALITPTCDTYSAGVILNHLLLGRSAKSVRETVKKVKREQGIVLPYSFRRLLTSMTQEDSLKRPLPEDLRAMAEEAAKDLSAIHLAKMILDKGRADRETNRKIYYFGDSESTSESASASSAPFLC